MRRRIGTGLMTAVLLAAALLLASAPTAPAVVVASDGELGFGVGAIVSGRSAVRTFGLPDLCVQDGRSATVTGVRFAEGSGLVVASYGTATQGTGVEVPGMVADAANRVGYTSTTLAGPCGDGVRTTLAVTVTLPPTGPTRAEGRGVVVDYVVNGAHGSLRLPRVWVGLCVGSVSGSDTCDPLPRVA